MRDFFSGYLIGSATTQALKAECIIQDGKKFCEETTEVSTKVLGGALIVSCIVMAYIVQMFKYWIGRDNGMGFFISLIAPVFLFGLLAVICG